MRELIAIEFDPDSDKVDVLTGKKAHIEGYSDLVSILKQPQRFRGVSMACR